MKNGVCLENSDLDSLNTETVPTEIEWEPTANAGTLDDVFTAFFVKTGKKCEFSLYATATSNANGYVNIYVPYIIKQNGAFSVTASTGEPYCGYVSKDKNFLVIKFSSNTQKLLLASGFYYTE